MIKVTSILFWKTTITLSGAIFFLSICLLRAESDFEQSLKQRHSYIKDTVDPDTSQSTDAAFVDDSSVVNVDSTEMQMEETDSNEVIPDKVWRAQMKAVYSTQKQRSGIDLSNEQATADLGLKISHTIGAYASLTGTQRLGANGLYQQTALSMGYMYTASAWCDLSTDLSFFKYPNDSVNAYAASPAVFSVSADFTSKYVDVGIGFDHYFGTQAVNNLGLYFSHEFALDANEDFSITPGLSVSYGAIKYKLGKSGKEKTVRGLNSVMIDTYFYYNIGSGFSLSVDPTIIVSYQKDLLKLLKGSSSATTKATSFALMVGLRYAIRF